ncbi:MAG: hypothetical protein ACK5CA_00030 [Cyanobacteriota bacterium]|jgi:hypothetical protein
MQTKKLVLLAALTTGATVGSLALTPPAEAILYNVSANLADVGTISGSFEYSPTTYSNWSLIVSGTTLGGGAFNTTYNTSNSFLGTNNSIILQVLLNGSDVSAGNYQYVALRFTDALTGVAGQSTTLVQGTNPLTPSIMVADGGGGFASIVINNSSSNVTAVPLESDALPIIGAAAFMAGGLWFKRRRTQAKANLDFLGVESEK